MEENMEGFFIPDHLERLLKAATAAKDAAYSAASAVHAAHAGGFYGPQGVYPIVKAREIAAQRAAEATAAAEKALTAYEEYAVSEDSKNIPYTSPLLRTVAEAVAEAAAAARVARAVAGTLEWVEKFQAPFVRAAFAIRAEKVTERAREAARAAHEAIIDACRPGPLK
jgi:hypothetical protein